MTISKKDCVLASDAANEAMKSEVLQRIGCVATVNGKIIAKGCNNYRTHSKNGIISNTMTCHAECNVLHKLSKLGDSKKMSKVVQEGSAICC